MKKEKTKDKFSFRNYYFAHRPKPVIDGKRALAVFFSAKSGCTFIVKWFFQQNQHLNAALDYHYFAHRYRNEVYVKSEYFLKSEADFINKEGRGYLKIKVVRNPFERAVSSYIHFLGMIKNRHKEIHNNFEIGYDKLNYSFSDFLTLLSGIDVAHCDIHWNQQFQIIERKMKFDYIIKLKDSIKILKEIEQKHQLDETKNMEILIFSEHHSKSNKNSFDHKFYGKIAYNFEIRENRPPYKCFYNTELEEMVRQIYKVDFEMYNFDLKYL